MEDYKISLYKIHLKKTGHTTAEGMEVQFRGFINTGGKSKEGNFMEVTIFFLDKNSPVPAKNAYKVGNERLWMYATIDEMPTYIDVLRNEKPVWLSADINNPEDTQIVTSWEDSGEGE